MEFLKSEDPFEIALAMEIIQIRMNLQDEADQNLANRISNSVWKSVSKKSA